MRQGAASLLRKARNVGRELRRNDPLIYRIMEGNLPQDGGPVVLHYLGRARFAHDFTVYFERQQGAPVVNHTFDLGASYRDFLRARARLRACPPDANILIVDRFLGSTQAAAGDAVLAPFLNAVLPVQADMAAQLAKVRSKGHRRKLQGALKRPLAWRQSRDVADFELWYDKMYASFVVDRFGDDANIVSKKQMLEMYTKQGFLLLLEEDGEAVSGAFMYTSKTMPGTLAYWKYALRDATTLSPNIFGERNAKTEAMVLSFATDKGYREIDFGLTRALPHDGIFQHKKRLGCDFRAPDHTPKFTLLLQDKSRVRFLRSHPLVVVGSGGLQVWTAHAGELDPASAAALTEMLGAYSFASLHGIELFVQGVTSSRPALLEAAMRAGGELNCRVNLRENMDPLT